MADIAESISTLVESIQRQSRMTHASVVLAATSILDNELERVLKCAMRPLSKVMYGRLFDSFRPLNAVSSKIIVAYALGAISRDTYDELEKIRAIRNLFSHSAELLNFGSDSIAPKFSALRKPPIESRKPAEVFVECAKVISDGFAAYLAQADKPPAPQSK
jgi:DNA-binding MltR family transcriptional regulator